MAEKMIRESIEKTAGDMEQWADDTKRLVGEIGAFLNEMKENGSEIPEVDLGGPGVGETIIRNVAEHLEEVKEAAGKIGQTLDL